MFGFKVISFYFVVSLIVGSIEVGMFDYFFRRFDMVVFSLEIEDIERREDL